MSGVSQNFGDEPPVVGEPASQPHQAAVVGEPPEEMGPVLGEPVLLANGLQQDKGPVPSSSPEESAINGVHKETSPVDEPFSDVPSSTHSNVENADPDMPTAADEHIMTEEASAEEGIRSAIENPIQPESTSETSDARAHGVPHADNPEDAEVTHITDAPLESPRPGSQALTENPFSVLDEGSVETDLNVSDEGEEPVVKDVHDEAQEEAVSPTQDEEYTKSLGPSTVDSPEEDAVVPVAHEEARGSSASTTESQGEATPTAASEESTTDVEQKNISDGVSEETKLSELSESEEVNEAEPQDSANNAVNAEDETVQGDEKMEEKPAEPGSRAIEEELVNSREAVLPEEVSNKQTPSNEGEGIDASGDASPVEVEDNLNREAVLSEVDKTPSNEGENQAAPDSSLISIDKNVTADAFPMESSGLRAIAAEASNVDHQPPSDETPLVENGFQHDKDGVPRMKEKHLSNEEKPSSRFKLPLVITTLAIAVVGVAVASFGRSRQ